MKKWAEDNTFPLQLVSFSLIVLSLQIYVQRDNDRLSKITAEMTCQRIQPQDARFTIVLCTKKGQQ